MAAHPSLPNCCGIGPPPCAFPRPSSPGPCCDISRPFCMGRCLQMSRHRASPVTGIGILPLRRADGTRSPEQTLAATDRRAEKASRASGVLGGARDVVPGCTACAKIDLSGRETACRSSDRHAAPGQVRALSTISIHADWRSCGSSCMLGKVA